MAESRAPAREGSAGVLPARRRFTVDEYHRMTEAGILHEDDRIELLDGDTVEMAPIGDQHAGCVITFIEWFGKRVRGRAMVSIQDPVRLSPYREP